MSEKTEKPTPKRLRDARDKGQVAKSKEIVTCAVIVGLFGYLWFFYGEYQERLQYLLLLPVQYYKMPFEHAVRALAKAGLQEFCLLSLPIALAAGAIVVVSFLAQIGFNVSFVPVKPDLRKISPVEGVKRIFSLGNLLELIKSVIKIGLLGAIVYLLIADNVQNMITTSLGGPQTALDLTASILKRLVLAVSALFIIMAVIDYFFQKFLYLKNLKMSKEDIRREYKDREGDPYMKGRRRQLQLQMAAEDMVSKIRLGTVVLIDPNERAVVIYYESGRTPLPIVSVKGKYLLAQKIAAMAGDFEVPVVHDGGLTRDLYDNFEQDSYVTGKYVDPLAVVLRRVIKIRKSKKTY